MPKYFNTTAICRPQEHYMVDITEKLKQILDVMRGFSGVGDDLKNAGSGMRSIASSIKSLSGVDTAFQSTFPRGERQLKTSVVEGISKFQSTFPRGERLQHFRTGIMAY